MNYEENTRRWQSGDVVIHDADAKKEEMLMIVRGYDQKTGLCVTNYRQVGYIAGMEKKYHNDIKYLHDPKRFGL